MKRPETVPGMLLGLPAPAKLNLFLHVTGRREDGYHLLQSIFVPVGLADEIDLAERTDGEIVRLGDIGWDPRKDLCVRAARLLAPLAPGNRGVTITVRKKIPSGAGLGGGSSDAATVLIGLNRLWRTGLSRRALMALSVRLGADVPFFVFGRTGFVEGIGERVAPFGLPEAKYRILWPGRGVSTAEIFGDPALTRDTESQKIAVFSDLVSRNWPDLPGRNDLEPAACRLEPLVGRALERLRSEGLDPRMTGSGSAVFAVVPSGGGAGRPRGAVPEGWLDVTVPGLSRHPLSEWLDDEGI